VHDLRSLLGPAGTASTVQLTERVSLRSVGRWIADGRLMCLHPGWVTLPQMADD
jgi:hypothetical protein